MITFAILAHNEEGTVANAVAQALQAAGEEDRVLVVDSGSTDDTTNRARQGGAEVLAGPVGKGAAMALAGQVATTPWVCFLDADLVEAERNIAGVLREAVRTAGRERVMIVGEFEDPPPEPILSNTMVLYPAMVRALVPEADGRFGRRPLSGFRAVRREFTRGMPKDFGVEAHLNLTVALSGKDFTVVPVGLFRQRFRYKPDMGREIARAILDVAAANGRLDPGDRPRWEVWVDRLVEVMAGYHGEMEGREAYLRRLREVSSMPPAKPAG